MHLGRLAGALGRHDEAEVRLRRAVAEDDRTGSRPYGAVARLRLGEVLAARHDADGACEALQRARQDAEALEMASVAADADRALGLLG